MDILQRSKIQIFAAIDRTVIYFFGWIFHMIRLTSEQALCWGFDFFRPASEAATNFSTEPAINLGRDPSRACSQAPVWLERVIKLRSLTRPVVKRLFVLVKVDKSYALIKYRDKEIWNSWCNRYIGNTMKLSVSLCSLTKCSIHLPRERIQLPCNKFKQCYVLYYMGLGR